MSNQIDLLVAERARALTVVLLTSRQDLHVIEPKQEDAGLQFLVEIEKTPGAARRQFGVVWRARVAPATDVQANQALRPTLEKLARAYDSPFPVSLFYFTMQDDKARYTWVAEPIVSADGQPQLAAVTEAHCATLDDKALDSIVRRVEDWYEARQRASPPTRRPRTGGEVLDAILDAQADFVAAHGKEPQTLNLPLRFAFDLAKLGRDRLGDLAETLILNGVGALEGKKLYGMTVHLVQNGDRFILA